MSELSVLIVDDMASMRTMTRLSLKKIFANVKIEEANNGKKAQEKLTSGTHFDIILCDWEMPDMNGAEFLKWLRTKSQFKEIPFIMVTAKNDQKFIETAIKSGVNDYITKPFSIDLLTKKVNTVLAEASKKEVAATQYLGEAVISSGALISLTKLISFGLHEIYLLFEYGGHIPHILDNLSISLSIGQTIKIEGLKGYIFSLELTQPNMITSSVKGGIKFTELSPKDMEGLIKFSNFLKK
ncbi:MAG: response regulator [Nitrospirae bacterium]|nr:response regulator [Nitrospirota bacterium]MBF0541660.1 response regulator [Nitrospirota bacterium]